MNSLEAASQAVRLGLAMKEQSDKSTPATYERHINHYVDWWTSYQAAEINGDSTKTVISGVPHNGREGNHVSGLHEHPC